MLWVSWTFPRGIPTLAVGAEPPVPLRSAVPWCQDPVFRQGVSLGSRSYFRGIYNKLRQVNAYCGGKSGVRQRQHPSSGGDGGITGVAFAAPSPPNFLLRVRCPSFSLNLKLFFSRVPFPSPCWGMQQL